VASANEGTTVSIPSPTGGSRRFLVGKKMGTGYWSHAFVGVDVATQGRVAIKIWRNSRLAEGKRDTFDLEHHVLSRGHARHSALLDSYGVGQTEEPQPRRAIVTELGGQTLTALIARGPLPVGKSVRIAIQVAHGADAVASIDYRHHDIKPDNVFIEGNRSSTVRLGDAGNARPAGRTTPNGRPSEYPATYSPPEINDDIHAVASILVDLLTGRISNPRRLDAVPPELRPVLAKALHKDPSQRYRNAQAFLDALAPFARGP
jgi:serine/threonine-protein kinase